MHNKNPAVMAGFLISSNMKICIVAIAKNENLYINEWINHHLNIGFDHIYVCDNNSKEKISDVVNNENVTILDYRNISNVQTTAYTKCYKQYQKQYDWIAFIDIDEYIILDNKSIKDFISDPIFKNAKIIRLHWKVFSGGSELEANGNYNVVDRFLDRYSCKEEKWGKSIINCSIEIKHPIYGHGYFDKDISNYVFNAIGEKCENKWSTVGEIPIHKNAWINHYPTKTIGEYIDQKYWRGGPNRNDKTYSNLEHFFKYNPENETLRQYGLDKIKKGVS